nr:hypothetical protein [Streptomyces sp. NRRL B-1347]
MTLPLTVPAERPRKGPHLLWSFLVVVEEVPYQRRDFGRPLLHQQVAGVVRDFKTRAAEDVTAQALAPHGRATGVGPAAMVSEMCGVAADELLGEEARVVDEVVAGERPAQGAAVRPAPQHQPSEQGALGSASR